MILGLEIASKTRAQHRPDGIITAYARDAATTETSCILVPHKSDSHGARKNLCVFTRRRTGLSIQRKGEGEVSPLSRLPNSFLWRDSAPFSTSNRQDSYVSRSQRPTHEDIVCSKTRLVVSLRLLHSNPSNRSSTHRHSPARRVGETDEPIGKFI